MIALLCILALLAVGAQAQFGPCKADGSYHLSCYTKALKPGVVASAKTQCFKSWLAIAPQCNVTIAGAYVNSYGCETAITYVFSSQACRELYQGQEKTNTACTEYNKNGLGDKANRLTAKATPDYACPLAGPCPAKGVKGSYHLSCYAKAITGPQASAAKKDCFKSWNKPSCMASVVTTYTRQFGCDTAITYAFVNDTCLAAYQAQEKTNTGCKLYNSYGLAKPENRQAARVQPNYLCPNAGPCKAPGSYHLSCYAKKITGDSATAAKTECFQAWNQPSCNATVESTLSGLFGCDTAITYSFANETCRASYQGQEKTNTACKLYNSIGLGVPANRMNTTASGDYTCTGPFRRMLF